MKASELTGFALDWAVAKCERWKTANDADGIVWLVDSRGSAIHNFNPSSNWGWGGPIIERERIRLDPPGAIAFWGAQKNGYMHFGGTALVAAMRCYVASKLGDKIDIPAELKNGGAE